MELFGLLLSVVGVLVALVGLWGLATGDARRFRIENRAQAGAALVLAALLFLLGVWLVISVDPGDVGIW